MLIYFKLKVTMVFDGKMLPLKGDTKTDRRKNKQTALATATSLLRQAKSLPKRSGAAKAKYQEADKYFKQAYSPKYQHAKQLMQALDGIKNVDYIVAPYEADAQLVYMFVNRLVLFASSLKLSASDSVSVTMVPHR